MFLIILIMLWNDSLIRQSPFASIYSLKVIKNQIWIRRMDPGNSFQEFLKRIRMCETMGNAHYWIHCWMWNVSGYHFLSLCLTLYRTLRRAASFGDHPFRRQVSSNILTKSFLFWRHLLREFYGIEYFLWCWFQRWVQNWQIFLNK